MENLEIPSNFSKAEYLNEFESLDFLHGALNSFAFLRGVPDLAKLQRQAIGICSQVQVASGFYPAGNDLDGVVFWDISDKLDVLIVNSDGSIAGTCGNALRCLGQLLISQDRWDGNNPCTVSRMTFPDASNIFLTREEQAFLSTAETFATLFQAKQFGPMSAEVTVGLGQELQARSLRLPQLLQDQGVQAAYYVELANPHIVLHRDNWEVTPLSEIFHLAKMLQEHPDLIENGLPKANIGFLSTEAHAPRSHKLKVYERGAGYTPACGSGAAAARISLELAQLASASSQEATQFAMPGGTLSISSLANSHGERLLTGPATQFAFDVN